MSMFLVVARTNGPEIPLLLMQLNLEAAIHFPPWHDAPYHSLQDINLHGVVQLHAYCTYISMYLLLGTPYSVVNLELWLKPGPCLEYVGFEL